MRLDLFIKIYEKSPICIHDKKGFGYFRLLYLCSYLFFISAEGFIWDLKCES